MMAPIYSRAAAQLLTTILLVSTIANAVALPHQVLDSRTPVVQDGQLPAEVSAALRSGVGEDADNVFQDVEDAFRSRTGLEVIRDFFARIFGWHDDDDESPSEPSVSITPTPSETFVTPSERTEIDGTSDASPEATTTPSPSADFSILPFGPMTTAINVTLPDPVFSLPPFLNSSMGPLPTAVPITGEFSAIPFPGAGTSLPSNGTATVSLHMTGVILVTATLSPPPMGTGTGLSNATAAFTEIPLFPNTTVTYIVGGGILATGTGSPVSFTELPLYPNATSSLPTYLPGTGTAVGTGAAASFTELPTYPNTTTVMTTIAPLGTGAVGTGTGTGSPVIFTEIPLFPNVTTLFSTTTTTLVGTGLPELLPSSNGTAAFNDTPSAFPG
ncbi:hypothetical protein J1614_009561 [Plenodomus biglobosus]|nr:hypothetical protein J1614_009561 [Plenodomus biglobosus]